MISNFKKIGMLLLIVFFASCNSSSNDLKIGIIENNKYSITKDLTEFKSNWNNILLENKIQGKITNLEIKKGFDIEGTPKDYYYLLATTTTKKAKIARMLLLEDNTFYLDTIDSTVAICHGSTDCTPDRFANKWGCNSDSIYDCKKTVILQMNE